MNQEHFVSEIAKLKPGSTFLTLSGYRNDHGEIADYNLVFNMSYQNALKRSVETLNALNVQSDLEKQAKKELLESLTKSLNKNEEEPIEEREDAYMHFVDDATGQFIKGVKLHLESGRLHLYGLVNFKRVLMPGHYPHVNHRPLTVAKNKMKSLCSVSKFRQFIVASDRVDSIQVQNLSLLPPE